MLTYAVYIRRSMRKEGDADISDEAQETAARARVPDGTTVRAYRDSGGHNSGFTTDRPDYQRMLTDLRRGELAGIAVASVSAALESGFHHVAHPFRLLGRIRQPRRLVAVPDEAEVVRRVFRDLATLPLSGVADGLNREGIRHRTGNPWTSSTVKDLWRRREVYRGNVVKKRGADTRPGTHEAILDEETYRVAVAGVERRKRRKTRSPGGRKREYLLRGLVYCSCGARMRGQARVSRGRDWRYYSCPVAEERSAVFGPDGRPIICPARSVRAEEAERAVLAAVERLSLPDEAIREAREELRRRLRAPASSLADKERSRLRQRIENLRKQHEWGDLSDAEYRSARNEAEGQLAGLPDHDKLVMFDRKREVLLSMAENIKRATPAQLQELTVELVERVETADRHVTRVV